MVERSECAGLWCKTGCVHQQISCKRDNARIDRLERENDALKAIAYLSNKLCEEFIQHCDCLHPKYQEIAHSIRDMHDALEKSKLTKAPSTAIEFDKRATWTEEEARYQIEQASQGPFVPGHPNPPKMPEANKSVKTSRLSHGDCNEIFKFAIERSDQIKAGECDD